MTTPSIFDLIPAALDNFIEEKPTTPDVSAYHQFDSAFYMKRLEQDAESAKWIEQHLNLPKP
jgi:hypothetical protein